MRASFSGLYSGRNAVNAPNAGGMLSQGVGWALLSLVLAALVCHFFFYLVPGLLGMKTGLPLYIVGTSTFGAQGGFLMPGFLMGVLQFGWVGVNVYFSSQALAPVIPAAATGHHGGLGCAGRLRRFKRHPVCCQGGNLPAADSFGYPADSSWRRRRAPSAVSTRRSSSLCTRRLSPQAPAALSTFGVLAFMMTYVVGFFATAGAAGVDFGTNSRDKNDVQMGGLLASPWQSL